MNRRCRHDQSPSESEREATGSWEIYEAVRPLSEHVAASLAAAYALDQIAGCVSHKGADLQPRITDIREAIDSVDAALDQLLDQLRARFLAQEIAPDHRRIGLSAIRELTGHVSGSMMMIYAGSEQLLVLKGVCRGEGAKRDLDKLADGLHLATDVLVDLEAAVLTHCIPLLAARA